MDKLGWRGSIIIGGLYNNKELVWKSSILIVNLYYWVLFYILVGDYLFSLIVFIFI